MNAPAKSSAETTSSVDPHGPPSGGFAACLRERTADLHTQAERSGVVNDILRGHATRTGYALLLRNLLPAYQAMEDGLERHRETPGVRDFALPSLYRAGRMAQDLAALCGGEWERTVAVLPAGEAYVERVALAARGDGSLLIAHAYARYLGDLSGGQILSRLLARSLGLGPEALSTYAFPAIDDPAAFKLAYRTSLDACAHQIADAQAVLNEAEEAFRLNIAVSEAVQTAAVETSAVQKATE